MNAKKHNSTNTNNTPIHSYLDSAMAKSTLHGSSTLRAGSTNNNGNGDGMKLLARGSNGFIPGPHDVICGRASNLPHRGNTWCKELIVTEWQRLEEQKRALAAMTLTPNSLVVSNTALLTQEDKMRIIHRVVATVQTYSRGGGFVKFNPVTGLWHQVPMQLAYQKVLEMMQQMSMEMVLQNTTQLHEQQQQQQQQQDYQKKRRQCKISMDAINQSFLQDYVKKQTKAMKLKRNTDDKKQSKQKRQAQEEDQDERPEGVGGHREEGHRKRRRRDSPGHSDEEQPEMEAQTAEAPSQTSNDPPPSPSSPPDSSLQDFLGQFANIVPEAALESDNPFEPTPIPTSSASSCAQSPANDDDDITHRASVY